MDSAALIQKNKEDNRRALVHMITKRMRHVKNLINSGEIERAGEYLKSTDSSMYR